MAEHRKKIGHFFYRPPVSAGQSIESMISAPLTAISKANCIMLSGQARFLLDFCFSKIENKEKFIYKPILIDMEITDSFGKTIIFQVPLLSILPISNIAVDNAKINFDIEITSVINHRGSKDSQADSNMIEDKAYLGAKFSNKKSDSDNCNTKSHMEVSLEAKQIPLPRGLTTILDLYTKNINPIQSK